LAIAAFEDLVVFQPQRLIRSKWLPLFSRKWALVFAYSNANQNRMVRRDGAASP
jgi:hypothetical protein